MYSSRNSFLICTFEGFSLQLRRGRCPLYRREEVSVSSHLESIGISGRHATLMEVMSGTKRHARMLLASQSCVRLRHRHFVKSS